MQEQVTLDAVLQGRREGLDKLGREIADEADGIVDQEFSSTFFTSDEELSDTGSKSGEELIFGKDPLVGECVHQARLPCIRIADNPDGPKVLPSSRFPMFGSRLLIDLQTFQDLPFAILEMPLHDFRIRLPESSHRSGSASSLPRQLHPHSEDPRPHVPDGSELDLELRLRRIRMKVENLKDEVDAIPGLDLRLAFLEEIVDPIDLGGLEYIPDDHQVRSQLESEILDLLKLPGSHVGVVIGSISLLDLLEHNQRTIGGDEILELHHAVFVFFRLGAEGHDVDQNDLLHAVIIPESRKMQKKKLPNLQEKLEIFEFRGRLCSK